MDVVVILLLFLSQLSLILFPLMGFYVQIVLNFTLFLVAIYLAQKRGYNIKRRFFRMKTFGNPTTFSLYMGIFYAILMLSAGFVMGFGKSPYSHTPLGLITNALYISAFVLGYEFSRAYLLRRIRKTWAIPAIAVFYTFLTLIPTFRTPPIGKLQILKYVGYEVIPNLTNQLFASILAYYAGAIPASVYSGLIMGFEWFSPILPKLDWMANAFIKALVPSIGYAIISSETAVKKVEVKREDIRSWIATFIACMLLILFFTGKLGVHPAIVGSGSMRPTIDVGDIVIVKKVNISDIHVGDIIQYYSNEGYTVTHRVIKMYELPNGTVMIVTKGDANDIPDKPFKADRVIGKVVFVIPKVGLIPIMIRDLLGLRR